LLTLRHLINIQVGAALTVVWGIGHSANVTVTAFDETAGTVTVNPPIPVPLSVKNGDYVVIQAVSAPDQTSFFSAKAKGSWGKDLKVRVRPIVGATYNLLVDPSLAANPPAVTNVTNAQVTPSDTITVADNTGFQPDDHIVIDGTEYIIAQIIGANQIKITIATLTVAVGTTVRQLRKANSTQASKKISVWGGNAIYPKAIVELSNGHDKETFTVEKTEGNVVTLSDAPVKVYYEGHKLRVIEAEATVRYAPGNTVDTEEIFSNLSLSDTGANYLVTQVTGQPLASGAEADVARAEMTRLT
jgi:hypothetical protein